MKNTQSNRRTLRHTVHLFLFVLALGGIAACGSESANLKLTVEQLTGGAKHHFFGYIGQCRTIPWNGSGRYVLGLEIDRIDRLPTPEEFATVILVDTHHDNKIIRLDKCHAWNPQQGTMFYWNPLKPETQFFFNDRDIKTGKVFTVLYDIEKKKRVREYKFDDTPVGNGGVAADGSAFLGINYGRLARLRLVTGYPEALDWSKDEIAPENDGIFIVDIKTGKKRLLVSYRQLDTELRKRRPDLDHTGLFINHTLWNRDSDCVYFFVRGGWSKRMRDKGDKVNIPCTINADGTGLTLHEQFVGGHPEWDEGNVIIGREGDRQVRYDIEKKKIIGQIGTPKMFPKPEGDISLSPDGDWFVNGYGKDNKNYYAVYRRSDGAFVRSEGIDKGGYSGDIRIDGAPRWNRTNDAILIPGIAENGTRQMFVLHVRPCFGKEYRIDSQEKFDALSTTYFHAGDTILFRRGVEFEGMFAPGGNGTEEAPIRIGVYGLGARPRINGGGKCPAGLLLQDVSYWEVDGLEITNTDGTDKDQGQLFGIYVLVQGAEGTYKHIYINDCYIHDVNGKVAGKGLGGIHVHVKGLEATVIDDLRITNNRIVRVGGVGIGNSSSCGRVEFRRDDTVNHNLWTRVYVAGNYIDNTGRNNVIARVSKDAVYEHNILANSSRYDTGHSIFCFNTDGMKIQYNEAYGNVGDDGRDRGGFDADYNCVNTFIQYNYSHDNMWFCGIMKRRNRNVVIRYNVSQNDKKGIYFYGFENERKAHNIHIYNNTHFVGKGFDVSVFCEGRTPINSLFENNIFYFEGRGKWGKNAKGINTSFRNNLYFNISAHESDTNPLAANPMFVEGGIVGTDIDLKTMDAVRGYRVRGGSPCIDTGVRISNHGGQDLLGTKVMAGKADVGAFERD